MNFLDSVLKYSKGIGYQASLKSEVQLLINSNTSIDNFILFDIGANIGNYSLLVAELFPKSTVYSFEPSKATFDQLVKNVKPFSQIIPIQIAFGEEKKKANFTQIKLGVVCKLYKERIKQPRHRIPFNRNNKS